MLSMRARELDMRVPPELHALALVVRARPRACSRDFGSSDIEVSEPDALQIASCSGIASVLMEQVVL